MLKYLLHFSKFLFLPKRISQSKICPNCKSPENLLGFPGLPLTHGPPDPCHFWGAAQRRTNTTKKDRITFAGRVFKIASADSPTAETALGLHCDRRVNPPTLFRDRISASDPAARLQRSTMDHKRKSGGGFDLDDRAAKRRKVPLVSSDFLWAAAISRQCRWMMMELAGCRPL
jgi:hypothetical protein